MSKVDKTDIKEQIAASVRKFTDLAKDGSSRHKNVIEMPEFIQQKAELISAHFLLPAGATMIDMGCETGEVAYVLALLNPRAEIIGIDMDEQRIEFARKTYKLPNLSYRVSDITIPDFEDGSVDAIVNSNILHMVYSLNGYNPEDVSALLEMQNRKLKIGGAMLIRDYIMPPEDQMVFLELPDVQGDGSNPQALSDADLLVRFSQSARPLVTGCEGFFLEEYPSRREGTRLFRLLHKWALEFIHRKDYRASWEKELSQEYTFYTWQDYRREFARLGMRMVYSAPYWNPWVVKNCFKGHFQLYTENYTPLNPPATNYFIVAQKILDGQSLVIAERRPSQSPTGELQILTVRDKKTGALHELVKRPGEYCDIVPYRITADNRLVIYVRGGYPRPIVNAVTRGSQNLDGKRWSGHLVEPITMDTVNMTDDIDENKKMIEDFLSSYTGLRPKGEEAISVGATYFPSPDRIDEAIEPVFIQVEPPRKTVWPIEGDMEAGFSEAGNIIELDATDVIRSSHVGLLPEPRLELHVFELMSNYQIPLPKWIGEVMPKLPGQAKEVDEPEDLLEEIEKTEFGDEKKGAVHLRPVKSVFVEEGKVGRATRGLAAKDVEFIITDDGIENIAVVVPLTRGWDNSLLVALDPKILPVPQRLGGDGAILNAPSFVLPKDVRSVEDAKAYVANKFGVPTDNVAQLGESYFTHVGVTPQRVYPFVVAAEGSAGAGPGWHYAPLKRLWYLWAFGRFSGDLLKSIARLHMMIGAGHGMAPEKSLVTMKRKSFDLSTEKVAVESHQASYTAIPSRVLGQRVGSASAGGGAAPKPQPEMEIEGVAPDASLLQQNQAAQKIIEDMMVPRVGKRLTHRYAEAISDRDNRMNVQDNETLSQIDRDIDEVGRNLKRLKETFPPAPDTPPKNTMS